MARMYSKLMDLDYFFLFKKWAFQTKWPTFIQRHVGVTKKGKQRGDTNKKTKMSRTNRTESRQQMRSGDLLA